MQTTPVMGLSVAVVKDGRLIYTHAFGLKDQASGQPLQTTDLFRIASISKSFSATSIMQLVQQKKLHLSDDVSRLMGFKIRNPRFPETVITLKMLLSHTSSLNDSQGYFTLDVANPDKNPDWAKAYNAYEPGRGYEYCNLNFNMVGTIIEKYSGQRFDHYVKTHILDPLGLYGGYNVNELDSTRFATLYEYNPEQKSFSPSPAAYAPRKAEIAAYTMGYSTPVFSPTGGMKISAPDLARYMVMHMNFGKSGSRRIIKKKYARLMQTPLDQKARYGLALRRTDRLIPGEALVGHTGSAYGLYSAMFFEPQKKFGIVAITNGCPADETDGYIATLKTAINILYEELVKK
ncbi:serine hydrolase domain-containing protein [Niabella terrae]